VSVAAEVAPLRGLVLAGGRSRRMQADKALLRYHDKPQLQWVADLIAPYCSSVHASVRASQRDDPARAGLPVIVDLIDEQADAGPIAGIHAAQRAHPDAAWLVVACDLPFLDPATLEHLIERRAPQRVATAYRSAHDGLPEPLCAIWEPASYALVAASVASAKYCPRALLKRADVELVELPHTDALDNVNTREERASAQVRLGREEASA
jgi:molybdopterin-guanine dinucleotide biosynthesis protein A